MTSSPNPAPAPSLPPASKKNNKSRWIIAAVILFLVLIVGLVSLAVVGVAGVAGYSYYTNQKTEGTPELLTPQKRQADYLLWSQSRQKLADWNAGGINAGALKNTPGLWERWFTLPPDSVARKVFQARLPVGYRLKDFTLGDYEKNEEGYHLTYHVTLIAQEDQFLAPVQRYPAAAKSKTFLRYSPYLILTSDLPAGLTYSTSSARKVFVAGQAVPLTWEVPLVAKVDGAWRVLDAHPLPLQRNPEFEYRAFTENGRTGALLLRSGTELSNAAQQAVVLASDLDARIVSIEAESSTYRQSLLAGLPGRGIDRGGAGGSGTPTKAGIGTVAGAGTGALIGGLAGGGDGAAIGAGAGAAAGLLGGFIVGRSDEKRAVKRQNSARDSAQRQAESRAVNHKAGLYKALENELKQKAAQHDAALLRGGFGEPPYRVPSALD